MDDAKRVLLVTNIPTPYRIPLYNELNRCLSQHGIRFRVLFGALQYRRRRWEVDMSTCRFAYDVLSSPSFERGHDAEKTTFIYRGLFKAVKAYQPDAIIIGGFSFAAVRIWLRSWTHPIAYLIWSGSIKTTKQPAGIHTLRRLLVRRASGFIAYGTNAKDYFLSLGAPEDKIKIAINTVDTAFFSTETEKLRRTVASRDDPVKHLLYIGYLTRGKNLLALFEAILRLSKTRDDFVLDIVGDGDDRPRLESFVKENNLDPYVHFHGYRQQQDVPPYFAGSHCFVFPSVYDIWGLVLVEAMAAGLPLISSIHAGATRDLVQEGHTGFSVDFSKTETVLDKINWILDHPSEAKRMGRNAQQFITEQATLEKSAGGFVEAVLATRPRTRSTP